MQQNIFLPVKYTKTFTLSESKLCGAKKVSQERPEGCQNELESIRVLDILWLKFFRIQVLIKKPSLENILLPFIHQAIKFEKQISKVSNELYRSRKTLKTKILDMKVVTASKLSVKFR